MPQAFSRTAPDVEQLSEQLRELERRVALLECQQGKTLASAPAEAAELTPRTLTEPGLALLRPRAPATWQGFPPVATPAGALSAIGKAVLGIAGAYLLRAIAESAVVPKLPVLIVAIVYAGLWLVWAVKTHAQNLFASVTYGITAALILSPLLWESTVRFQVLAPSFSAVILVAFVVLSFALSWKRSLEMIPWVAMLASVITAWALIIATHNLAPLICALLAIALATEAVVCMGHRLSLRAVPAIAADLAVLLLVELMTSPEGAPFDYPPVAPVTIIALSLALLAIYGGSIGIRSFGLRQRLTIFEIIQAAAAFALATFGTLRASHGAAAPSLGVLFLVLAAVCYWGTLLRFAEETHVRNRRVSANWAAALLLAGSFLLFSAHRLSMSLQVMFLCAAAMTAVLLYTRTRKLSLGMHASFYLAAATAVSPLPTYVGNALAGTVPPAPDWAVWIVAGSSMLGYAVGSHVTEDHGSRRLLWAVPAGLTAFTMAALAVSAVWWLAAGRVEMSASRLSVIRTLINCGLALALAFLGVRWKRIELGWVAYAAVAFGTLKLLFEDLRYGNPASLVLSLLFYGSVLILLPRLMRRGGSSVAY
ncbi:MAG: hypothetical protein ACLQLC_10105 [Candidatus Sulfotelmatobacter sp.]